MYINYFGMDSGTATQDGVICHKCGQVVRWGENRNGHQCPNDIKSASDNTTTLIAHPNIGTSSSVKWQVAGSDILKVIDNKSNFTVWVEV